MGLLLKTVKTGEIDSLKGIEIGWSLALNKRSINPLPLETGRREDTITEQLSFNEMIGSVG
ncbi:unnamed protein product [marine sediment metagenome]|uniref:Uncharacterized protein n=1 Tax=marine sediment metagenome TaxID=412755 RepID=X1TN35_9ZZZZ